MSIKKVIAGYFKEWQEKIYHEDGSFHIENKREWIPQKEMELHPLEQAEYHAGNKLAEIECERPCKPTLELEHEWLIEYGPEYVKERRKEWKNFHDKWDIEYQKHFDEYKKVCESYCSYFNGLNPRS